MSVSIMKWISGPIPWLAYGIRDKLKLAFINKNN